jgi:hypothetical protein
MWNAFGNMWIALETSEIALETCEIAIQTCDYEIKWVFTCIESGLNLFILIINQNFYSTNN